MQTESQHDASRERLSQEAQSYYSSSMYSAASGSAASLSGALLLKTIGEDKRPVAKVLAITSMVTGAVSGILSLFCLRWAKRDEAKIAQIDLEKAAVANTTNEAAAGGHVTRLQQAQASEISR